MNTILLAAITADGYIGRTSSHTADWTSKADKQLFVSITKAAGTIVMGSRTFETIGRALPDRRMIVMTSRPEAYDTTNVTFTSEGPQELVDRLTQEGTSELVVCGGAQIYHAFMQAGLVDELYITIEPLLFGRGVSLFVGELSTRMVLLESRTLSDNVMMLRYKVLHETS